MEVAANGSLARWQVGGRDWLLEKEPQPWGVTLADGSRLLFEPEKEERGEESFVLHGHLTGTGGRLPVTLRYEVQKGGETLRLLVRFNAAPEKNGPKVEEALLLFPLRLDHHKKVYFHGDHRLDWESRYFYQFTLDTIGRLLPMPDTTIWRWFGAEQLGPDAFRLWKAESEQVSPLVMQEGRRLAPYVQVYDRRGGVTVHYPQLSATGQRALRVDAVGGAVVQVGLQVPNTPGDPLPLTGEHEILLHADAKEPALLARRQQLNATFQPSPAVNPGSILEEGEWVRTAKIGPGYVIGGYPFAKGVLQPPYHLRVKIAGEAVPLQSTPIGYWPDGSAKWVLLTFPINPAQQAKAGRTTPAVTLRDGRSIPLEVEANATPLLLPETTPKLSGSLVSADEIKVANGALEVRFRKGSDWWSATLEGEPLFSEAPIAYADFHLDPERLSPLIAGPKGGTREKGVLEVTALKLEESGPLRAVVRLEGEIGGKLKVILRATLLAGRPEVALSHTTEWLRSDPRTTFLGALGVELPLAGLKRVRFDAREKGSELLVEHPLSRKLGISKGGATRYQPSQGEGGGVEATLRGGARFQGVIRHLARRAPKAIVQREGRLRFELWPGSLPPMDLRRYSDLPHMSQGETARPVADWVETSYYPHDPITGLSRTHELLFRFQPKGETATLATTTADLESPPLLYAGWERYQFHTLPSGEKKHWSRAWDAWTRFTHFWLYHQQLHQWHGFWNDGDFRHRFQGGYGWIATPEMIAKGLQQKEPTPMEPMEYDYQIANDWAYDNGRWGWSNTEGLANLFLQHEYLRHGNRAVYFAAEAMARFSRDVVIRHNGPWLGKGTRHGVQHWSDGNHEERQTTSTEYRLHYFLSGDPRTREVVEHLYTKHYAATPVTGTADHSGRWGGLFFHHELSGSEEEGEQLRRYARAFVNREGLLLDPHVGFPGGNKLGGDPQSLNAAAMFFACYGGMHYLLEYQQTFEDQALAAAIIRMADATLALKEEAPSSDDLYLLPPVAFAALHSPEPERYRAHLRRWLSHERHWRSLYQSVTCNPTHWSGASGLFHENMPGSLFFNNWAGLITCALGEDTFWTPAIAARYEQFEKEGQPKTFAPSLWRQADFEDLPPGPVRDYLRQGKPW